MSLIARRWNDDNEWPCAVELRLQLRRVSSPLGIGSGAAACKSAGQGPVVQSIVSLTSSLKGQLVQFFYDFVNKYTDIFCRKNESSFPTTKASHTFSTKNIVVYKILMFEILTINFYRQTPMFSSN